MSQRSSDDLKLATTTMARQAAQKAVTGPQSHVNVLHGLINNHLDELQNRGDLKQEG